MKNYLFFRGRLSLIVRADNKGTAANFANVYLEKKNIIFRFTINDAVWLETGEPYGVSVAMINNEIEFLL